MREQGRLDREKSFLQPLGKGADLSIMITARQGRHDPTVVLMLAL